MRPARFRIGLNIYSHCHCLYLAVTNRSHTTLTLDLTKGVLKYFRLGEDIALRISDDFDDFCHVSNLNKGWQRGETGGWNDINIKQIITVNLLTTDYSEYALQTSDL